MRIEIFAILGVIMLIVASFCGCSEDDDEDEENGGNGGEGEGESEGEGFKLYEWASDWAEANENSKPMTGLDAITLAMDNIDILAPGSTMGVMSSTEFDSEGANKDTGKAIAWQFYFYKPSGDKYTSRIVNVAENGGYLVKSDYEVANQVTWEYNSASIDTDELPGIIATDQATQDWLTVHPSATLTIQTANGVPFGTQELSWLLWYKNDSEQHQVYISALDGEILE